VILGLGQLKFRHKLLLPAGVAVVAMLLTAVFSLWSARRGDAILRAVEEREAPALELARDLENLLAQLQRGLQDAVEAEDEGGLEEADRLHAELLGRLGAGERVLDETRGRILREELGSYHALARSVSARLIAGVQPQAVMGELERMTGQFAALRTALGEDTARARGAMRESFAEARVLQVRSAATTAVAALLAALLALGLSTWIAASVSRPLEALEATALRIAREGDLTQRVEVSSRDEVGLVAESFRGMVQRLRSIISTLRDASSELSGASETLGQLTRDQGALLAKQASGVSETSATTRELEQTSSVASQRAAEVLEVARRGGERSDAGLASVGRSLDGIQLIRDHVSRVLDRVGALADGARQVGDISETVEELADRSHVLSINASLEAIRAGESGKGFAVVATEVRALAQQSRDSAGRIAGIVRDILSAIHETVALSDEGHRQLEESLGQVRESGESLREIGGIVRETSSAALQIAAAVQQQGSGVRQIAQAMADIDGGMEVTVQRIRAMDQAAARLAGTSDRITAVVREFRL